MKKTRTALSLGVFVLIIVLTLSWLNLFQVFDWKISDLFFVNRTPSEKITIIAIDEKSLSSEANLGRFKDWPRGYYAELLLAINGYKPSVVAFDLDFKEASRGVSALRVSQVLREYERGLANGGASLNGYEFLKKFDMPAAAQSTERTLTHPDDIEFQNAISKSGPIVLTTSFLFSSADVKEEQAEFPQPKSSAPPIFKGENVATGFINVFRDRDGVLRRFAPWAGQSPHFAIAIAHAFFGTGPAMAGLSKEVAPEAHPYSNPEQKSSSSEINQTLIRYTARPNSYRTVSFVDALRGNFRPEDIQGKIVLVGGTARVLQDLMLTPTSRTPMAGVEVVANIVEQAIEGRTLQQQGGFSFFLSLLLISLIGSFIFFVIDLQWFGFVFGAALILWPFATFGLYQAGRVWSTVYPEAALIMSGLIILWHRNKTELAAKREIKKAFAHYVSPVVVNELAKHPEMLTLGGKRQNISVLFSDIVGFTTLSEKLSPEDTVALLNDYLTSMTEVIFDHQGTLDKYQGDAIMALFGAPLADSDHAVNACAAALGMRKALSALHEKWNSIPDLPMKEELVQLDFRVGIATGPAVIGNVGSEKRFDYTAIGDIVNLGSRLESVNRKYGTHVIVDKGTFTAVTETHNPFVFRKLDTIRVKGKTVATEIFEVVTLAENATSDLKSMLDDFENGRILYTQRNFIEAKQYFASAVQKVPGDSPSQIYLQRCSYFLRKPPRMDWDAIVDLAEK